MVIIENPLENNENNIEISQQTIFYSMNSDLSNVNLDSDNRKIILLDIDDTLYKPSPKLLIHKRKRAKDAFEHFKAEDDTFYKWKNEVSAGLKQNEFERLNVSPIVLEKFKNIQYDQFINKDELLVKYLRTRNDYRFFCFTNAIQFKAEKIIKKLGIYGLIEGVVCCDDHNQRPILKPMEESYKFVEKLLKINDSNRNSVYFFDDKKENLDYAKGLGWNVGLVGECDYIVDVFKKHKI